jgi:hypothetical protein
VGKAFFRLFQACRFLASVFSIAGCFSRGSNVPIVAVAGESVTFSVFFAPQATA